MEEKPTSFELRPPPPAEPLLPSGPAAWQIALAAVALLFLILLIVLLTRRSKKTVDPTTLRTRAYREALRALEEARPPTSREAATFSSLVLRRYLAVAASDPALYETHEEFIARRDSLAKLPEPVKAATVEGFANLAALKYSKESAEGEPAPVITSSRELLETLNLAFAA